jgi:drug/metabolite transporter (DMT)-like permease
VASALSFSLSAVIGKNLLDELGVTSLLFWRFGIAAVVLWSVLALWGRHRGVDVSGRERAGLFGLGLLTGVVVIVGFLALERLDVSVYIVIVYLYPAFVVIGSRLLGRPFDRWTSIALVLIMCGIVLTVPEVVTGMSGDSVFSVAGLLLASCQAVLFAVYVLLSERAVPPQLDGPTVAAWINLGAGAFFVPFVLVGGLTVPRGAPLISEVALFALVPTVIANVCFFRALRHLSPSLMAMVMTLEVAFAIAWSATLLGEDVSAVQVLGAGVMMTGVVLAQRAAVAVEERLVVAESVPGH